MLVITIGTTANGKDKRLNKDNAGNTKSVDKLFFEVKTKTAKVEQLTKNGAKFQVKLVNATKHPFFSNFSILYHF